MCGVDPLNSEHRQEWEGKVYKKMEDDFGMSPEEWSELRKEVIRRDKFRCKRCDEKFRGFRPLTVHHIMPRAEGGHNGKTNLLSLCVPCHDYVEIHNLRTRADIQGSYDFGSDPAVDVVEKDAVPDDEDDWRPDWHKHVYGGVKRERWNG